MIFLFFSAPFGVKLYHQQETKLPENHVYKRFSGIVNYRFICFYFSRY